MLWRASRSPIASTSSSSTTWSGKGTSKRWTRRPRNWPGRNYRPGTGNHPVTAVNWYDATAYAAWLDAQLRAAGVLGVDETIRLPSEPEWERAAAYPIVMPKDNPLTAHRDYPWGEWPETQSSNQDEIDVAGTC
ncbi:MAG: formylglycine-generating enzyme family protein [Blastochloris sp.]|nr:formylglycine-generating enzyme family protein [Blastochloris sp.]